MATTETEMEPETTETIENILALCALGDANFPADTTVTISVTGQRANGTLTMPTYRLRGALRELAND